MAYDGSLIKFTKNNELLPGKYIQSYKSTPNQRLDQDDYTDANGELHRNVLDHQSTKIEWNTPPMKLDEWENLMAILRRNQADEKERCVYVRFYDFETCQYKEGKFYIPDFTVEIHLIDKAKNDMILKSVRFAIIEY